MLLNDAGKFANKCWLEIPEHFPHVTLDEFIVMPNHIHGIIIINTMTNVGVKILNPYTNKININKLYQNR